MWLIGKLSRNKRGTGSIIGAVFIVLILSSGYAFYTLNVNVTEDYTNTLQDMQQLDLKRNNENIEFTSVSTTSENKLNITVKNVGSYQIQFILLGIFNETSTPATQEYYELDVYIESEETVSNIPEENITIPPGQKHVIQLVTKMGNTFSYSYPPSTGVTITGKNCTAMYTPSQWNLLGSTGNVSGSVSDLASNDINYVVFRSYLSGTSTNMNDFVDNNTSDVDSSADKGTHSNFTAQQYGPDSIYNTLSEGDTGTASSSITITTGKHEIATGIEQGSSVFRNPRGLKYYYAFVCDYANGKLSLYKSSDGSSWAFSALVSVVGDENAFDYAIYNDGTQLVIYVVYGKSESDGSIYYCRLTIADSTSDPTVGSSQEIPSGAGLDSGKRRAPVIMRDRNGYIIVGYNQWVSPNKYKSYIIGTTATNPGDAPSWCTEALIEDITTANPLEQRVVLVSFGGTGDIGGVIYSAEVSVNTEWIKGRDIVSFDGADFVLGTSQTISDGSDTGQHYPFSAVVDSNNYAHLLYDDPGDGYPGTRFKKASTASTVESWGSTFQLDSNEPQSLTMSIKKNVSPNKLYAFYHYGTTNVRYKTSPVDTISWGAEAVITESADLDWLSSSHRDQESEVHLVWTQTASPYNVRYTKISTNFELDLEVQWTSVDYSGQEELCIYAGSFSGAEDIRVDYWTGSEWSNLFTGLTANSWNNVSVTITATSFTIRFKGGTETGDTNQNSWNIDVALLHVWTEEYTAEVEFTGSSNLEDWTKLDLQIDSCWDIGEVTVTIQFYNYTLGDYSPSGNGYINYVSNAAPNTDELKWQTITLNPDNFKNSTGHWRVKIKGVKSTSTQFLMKIDWIEFKTKYSSFGNSILYGAWQWFTIKATTTAGNPIPYGYISIYANGTNLAFRNAINKESVSNPGWVRLNADGEYQLEIKSAHESAETFVLYVVVGSAVGQKTITQEVQG